jgi:hypothetical protein
MTLMASVFIILFVLQAMTIIGIPFLIITIPLAIILLIVILLYFLWLEISLFIVSPIAVPVVIISFSVIGIFNLVLLLIYNLG